MNLASLAVLAVVGVLCGLAVWRNVRKGSPCMCGGNCSACGGCRRKTSGK